MTDMPSSQSAPAITIQVNGQPTELPQPCSVSDLLEQLQTGSAPVAVERNREVVPRSRHATTLLEQGDQVEVVTLVGGG